MFKRIILYVIFLNTCLANSPAQEVITGLRSNYRIINNTEKHKENKGLTSTDTLALPFFDDFSGHSIFPESNKWTDNYVFINNTYSDRQITAGIATFDALDNSGRMYDAASVSGFEADHLTSQPINLNYSASDNIWLSFFYQAGGLGDPPEANDSRYGKLKAALIKDLNRLLSGSIRTASFKKVSSSVSLIMPVSVQTLAIHQWLEIVIYGISIMFFLTKTETPVILYSLMWH